MSKKVLITGGAGFIGSHTADACARKGYTVRILDNLSQPSHLEKKWPAYTLRKGYELFEGSVVNRDDFEKALEGVDYVIHLAGYMDQLLDFSTFFNVNTVSTALLYEIIVSKQLPIRKIVIASSQFVYGDGVYRCNHHPSSLFFPELRDEGRLQRGEWDVLCEHGVQAESVPFQEGHGVTPPNSYGISKKCLEDIGLRLGKTHGIPTTIFRYSIVQGPRQSPFNIYSGVLRIFISQALVNLPLTVYEDGNQLRDFVNIEDVVDANMLGIEDSALDYQVFNVGGGIPWKIKDFAELVQSITQSRSCIEINGIYRKTDARHSVSDLSKLQSKGWRPRFTPQKSIVDYVDWLKDEGYEAKLCSLIQEAPEILERKGITGRIF